MSSATDRDRPSATSNPLSSSTTALTTSLPLRHTGSISCLASSGSAPVVLVPSTGIDGGPNVEGGERNENDGGLGGEAEEEEDISSAAGDVTPTSGSDAKDPTKFGSYPRHRTPTHPLPPLPVPPSQVGHGGASGTGTSTHRLSTGPTTTMTTTAATKQPSAPALALTRSMNGPPGTSIPGRHPSRDVMNQRPSEVDWALPLEDLAEKQRHSQIHVRPNTVAERIEPTLAHAIRERDKFALRAKTTGWSLNIAIGMQVLLGTLTTGLSAATTTARQIAVMTAVLGGLSTLVASFLAKMRGSNEPEFSIGRVKDLDHFIRECESFKLDEGHNIGPQYDARVREFRTRLEEMLGNNTTNSESEHRPTSVV